jgi:hypothetical protein
MISPQALQALLLNHQVIPLKFAGNRMLLDGHGVLVWPAQNLLIFSDLHLEKGSFLTQFANPLPRFDSKDTLKRMRLLIERYDCKHIVCLGDSLHDGNALSRMQQDDLKALNAMVKQVARWTWVLGNHDPEIPLEILGERCAHLQLQNVLMVHEPEDLESFLYDRNKAHSNLNENLLEKSSHKQECTQDPSAQIIGHFHPKSSYKISNRKVTGKTFIQTPTLLLMPAFGKYTGGLDINDKAFTPLFARKEALVYLTYHQKIYLL